VPGSSVYLHFSSKQTLLTALGERFAEKHLACIKAALAATSEPDWAGKLKAWAKASVTFYLDSMALHDMLFHEARAPTREGLIDNLIIDHLTGLLNAGNEAGAWPIDDARFTAVFLFSGVHGIVDDAYVKEKRIARGRLIRRLQRICFRSAGLQSDDNWD
jgi:AcrR family transcriptional regulator